MADIIVSFPKPCEEPWDGMTAQGCDRICASCDRIVHDLTRYSIEEVEAMARRDPYICVRAAIGSDGRVALKSGGRVARRMLLAVGAIGALAASEPLAAKEKAGAISGTVGVPMTATSVSATSSTGKRYHAKFKSFGNYRFNRLPAGVYRLTLTDECGSDWSIDNVTVAPGVETTVAETIDPNTCEPAIIIGMLKIENDNG